MRIGKSSHLGAHRFSTRAGTLAANSSRVPLDLYLPDGLGEAPLVLVAHGFSRSRKNMAGWGRLLASHGFIAAVPDLPGWSDYHRNAQVLIDLLNELRRDGFLRAPKPLPACALLGYSLGGLATLLAAAAESSVRCWVGLDPIDLNGAGMRAAGQFQGAGVVLCAEPSPWNSGSRQLIRSLAGPRLALRVRRASHSDLENPTDWFAQFFCGAANAARRAVFEGYTLAALRSLFYADDKAREHLAAIREDRRVSTLAFRALHGTARTAVRGVTGSAR